MSNIEDSVSSERYSVGSDIQFEEILMDELLNSLDELDVPQVHIDGDCHHVSSDENLELVQNAFPADVDRFLKLKEVKESKRKSRYSEGTVETPQTPNMRGAQMAITDYYHSSKTLNEVKSSEDFRYRFRDISFEGKEQGLK